MRVTINRKCRAAGLFADPSRNDPSSSRTMVSEAPFSATEVGAIRPSNRPRALSPNSSFGACATSRARTSASLANTCATSLGERPAEGSSSIATRLVSLPPPSGFLERLNALRAEGVSLPILMLSALGAVCGYTLDGDGADHQPHARGPRRADRRTDRRERSASHRDRIRPPLRRRTLPPPSPQRSGDGSSRRSR